MNNKRSIPSKTERNILCQDHRIAEYRHSLHAERGDAHDQTQGAQDEDQLKTVVF